MECWKRLEININFIFNIKYFFVVVVVEIQSAHKLQSDVKIVNLDDCMKNYHDSSILLRSSQFCASAENTKETCFGDLGGPVMVAINESKSDKDQAYWYLAGILSFGPKQCEQSSNVFTRVTSFTNWILENIMS